MPPVSSNDEKLAWQIVPLLNGAMACLYTSRFADALQQLEQAVAVLERSDEPPGYLVVWETCGIAAAFLTVEHRLPPGVRARLEELGATLDRLLDAAPDGGEAPSTG